MNLIRLFCLYYCLNEMPKAKISPPRIYTPPPESLLETLLWQFIPSYFTLEKICKANIYDRTKLTCTSLQKSVSQGVFSCELLQCMTQSIVTQVRKAAKIVLFLVARPLRPLPRPPPRPRSHP